MPAPVASGSPSVAVAFAAVSGGGAGIGGVGGGAGCSGGAAGAGSTVGGGAMGGGGCSKYSPEPVRAEGAVGAGGVPSAATMLLAPPLPASGGGGGGGGGGGDWATSSSSLVFRLSAAAELLSALPHTDAASAINSHSAQLIAGPIGALMLGHKPTKAISARMMTQSPLQYQSCSVAVNLLPT